MAGIRSESIQQAIRLKTSTTNVAQVKADLYRQGLSDSEVNSRSESILKFATVTGTKVTAATKIITTALQNDLVNSAEHAMDVLTALGDSAATTAEEIGKGMQKSAAAAKVAGVSYEELASMLTIITSKTQLGGTQAGTALNAIFNRMHRVTATGLVNDEEGAST
jgi:TP901 family phage tail tape measure protein